MKNPLNLIPILFIDGYKLFLSPFFPNSCRFSPSCSTYCRDAFRNFGFFRASILSTIRICKCQPFHPGGYDPLPIKQGKE